jgi:hypothetical protein
VAGGAGVTEAAYERLLGPITGSGRYGFNLTSAQYSTPAIFADNTGRQVKAYANQAAIVRGYRWESGTTPPVVALDANTSGNPRIDLIVLRLDRSTYTVRLGKTNGTPAAVPAAPAAIQDTSSSGVWELPLATVRVTSSGTTGQPFIQSTDVTPLDWWIAPPPVVTKTGQLPPISHGQVVHYYDTNRTYRAVGNALQLEGENGAYTKITVASGWTTDNVYCQRRNGWTYFQCWVTSTGAAKTPSTDLGICTLPAEFRPPANFLAPVWMTPEQVGVVSVRADGAVIVSTYGTTFPTGGQIVTPPMSWPSV